jgi:hypothetical protein
VKYDELIEEYYQNSKGLERLCWGFKKARVKARKNWFLGPIISALEFIAIIGTALALSLALFGAACLLVIKWPVVGGIVVGVPLLWLFGRMIEHEQRYW